ncbi:MAG: transcriptional repressor [Firmicutes bacterium]|nr:transcriptional repressor [Bacillota bacterium]
MSKGAQRLYHLAREQGIRLTIPRKAVLQAIADLPNPFTATQVLEAADSVGRATVFRTLQLLCATKILEHVRLVDGQQVYVAGHPPTHHHHLICNACGTMRNIHDTTIGELADSIARAEGFFAEAHSFEIYGLCASCRQEED